VVLQYLKAEYPVLVEWKMTKTGTYVVGLEPANCHVEGRAKERMDGTLTTLQSREVRHFGLTIAIVEGEAAIKECEAIQRLDSVEEVKPGKGQR
jgi:hypothetical protein